MKVDIEHPAFLLKSKVQEATREFLDSFGFNYFQYLRCYADGSIGLLTNHTGLLENFDSFENSPVIFSSYDDAPSYWFLWDESLPEFPVQMAREQFNFRHGLTYVRRSKNYYDMIAVAVANEQNHPGGFYLNKQSAILQFIRDFDKENKDLLTLMEQNPIALSEPHRDVNYKNLCLATGRIPLGDTYITAQELACLRSLLQGDSHKQIAAELSISPRTVETYVKRMKMRTGYANLQDLAFACP